MMSWPEVAQCARAGMSIECHTVSHPDLRHLSPAEVLSECERADAEIAARIGAPPKLFAYPYGAEDATVHAVVGARYEACFSTRMGYLHASEDRRSVSRLETYYLQSPELAVRVLSLPVQLYMRARALVRHLRGVR